MAERGFGVQRRARLVHQDDFGLERQQPGDAELLLLLELKRGGLRVQPVLEVVPEGDLAQRLFDRVVQVGSLQCPMPAVDAQAEDDVLVDRDGQRVRALEHHADRLAQLDQRHVRVVDVLAEDRDFAGGGDVAVALVDAVEAAQQRGLAAAGRADQRGDLAVADIEVDVLQRLEVAVPEVRDPRVSMLYDVAADR